MRVCAIFSKLLHSLPADIETNSTIINNIKTNYTNTNNNKAKTATIQRSLFLVLDTGIPMTRIVKTAL